MGSNNFLMGYAEEQYDMDPRLFTAIMWMTMGVMGVVPLIFRRSSSQTIHFDAKLLFPLACGLLLGVGILTFSHAMGQKDMTAGATAAVATSNAVFTAVLAFALLKENLTLQQWTGIGVVVLGIILLRV